MLYSFINMKKNLLILLGILSLTIAVIGIFVPLLPTTSFLLLSAYLFSKSSDRLHRWLVGHKQLGKYISNYTKHKGMYLKDKIVSISILWLGILLSIYFVDNRLIVFGLIIIGFLVSTHIFTLKTINK